jgi:hypothetical protein
MKRLNKKVFLSLLFSVFLLSACSQTNCKDIPTHFKSYDEAISVVRNAGFAFKETVNTSKSSWIRGASFYSCDRKVGYFILKTDKKSYIYKDMPVEVWEKFKNAPSFGSYYNSYIKGRYILYLN